MALYVTKIRTEEGDKQIDYNALANLPNLEELRDHTHTPESIGAAKAQHVHKKSDIEGFPTSLPANGGNADTVGGKSVSDFAAASDVEQLKTKVDGISLESLGLTVSTEELVFIEGVTSNIQSQLNTKAPRTHDHSASQITSGTISTNRLPVIPISHGGTEASDGATGLANLFAAGITILSENQYGPELPDAGNPGRFFLKKVNV
jgi:hypothetical protein